MSEYKLIYFNFAAVAEPIRWILKYAQVPFEDERINPMEWEKNKPRFPLGKVPILVVDGKEMTQSAAIVRYLAKKFGLLSGDDDLDYKVDEVVEIVMDGRQEWHKIIDLGFSPEPEVLQNLKDDLTIKIFPKILKHLSSLVGDADGDFILGKKITYGDFVLAHWLQLWTGHINSTILDNYPILIKHMNAVLALPQIKAWVETRPEVWF